MEIKVKYFNKDYPRLEKIGRASNKTIELEDFLIGSKLGDGAFIQRTPTHNTYIVFKHSELQYDYLEWKYHYLKSKGYVKSKIKTRNWTTGKKTTWHNQYYFPTISMPDWNRFNKYTIKELLDKLTLASLAIWILDDGNIYEGICKIACGRFTVEEKEYACNIIKNNFNIDAMPYEHPANPRKGYIRIPRKEYHKIKSIIATYMPSNLDVVINKLGKINTSKSDWIDLRVDNIKEWESNRCILTGKDKEKLASLPMLESVVKYEKGDVIKFGLGIAVELPEGYEAEIRSRSSTFGRYGLTPTNCVGTIDNSYKGDNDEWQIEFIAMRNGTIERFDRVCQFRIWENQPEFKIVEVDHLDNENRGGYGTTGR